ncbi:MAG: hypothetical protein AAB408_04675 [Patescibacteria group bacterium]
MPANPQIIIMLPRNRYAGLYDQWMKNKEDLSTDTQVRWRLMLLLRAGMFARGNIGLPGPENIVAQAEKKSRRKTKKSKLFYSIRCRIDTRLYPDILDEWRALPRGSRSEVFAEYLRIGMKMTPDELRDITQKATKNFTWKQNTKIPEPVNVEPRGETVIVAGPSDADVAAATTAKIVQNFLTLDD